MLLEHPLPVQLSQSLGELMDLLIKGLVLLEEIMAGVDDLPQGLIQLPLLGVRPSKELGHPPSPTYRHRLT